MAKEEKQASTEGPDHGALDRLIDSITREFFKERDQF